jgi:hypothetical protein
MTKHTALAESAVSVLRETGVVRYCMLKTQTAKLAVCQIEMNFLAQSSFRPDAKAIANDQHSYHQLGIHRWPTDVAVELGQML